jgi:hypothetical protein
MKFSNISFPNRNDNEIRSRLSKLMRQKQDENVQDAIFGFDKKD